MVSFWREKHGFRQYLTVFWAILVEFETDLTDFWAKFGYFGLFEAGSRQNRELFIKIHGFSRGIGGFEQLELSRNIDNFWGNWANIWAFSLISVWSWCDTVVLELSTWSAKYSWNAWKKAKFDRFFFWGGGRKLAFFQGRGRITILKKCGIWGNNLSVSMKLCLCPNYFELRKTSFYFLLLVAVNIVSERRMVDGWYNSDRILMTIFPFAWVEVKWHWSRKKSLCCQKKKTKKVGQIVWKSAKLSPSIPRLKYLNKMRDGRVFWPSWWAGLGW